jgi:hypothetical protein
MQQMYYKYCTSSALSKMSHILHTCTPCTTYAISISHCVL